MEKMTSYFQTVRFSNALLYFIRLAQTTGKFRKRGQVDSSLSLTPMITAQKITVFTRVNIIIAAKIISNQDKDTFSIPPGKTYSKIELKQF